VFLPWHRRHWAETPTQSGDAFVRAAHLDRDAIFCTQHKHTVATDNTVTVGNVWLPIVPQKHAVGFSSKSANIGTDVGWRAHYVPHLPGWYETNGRAIGEKRKQAARAEKTPFPSGEEKQPKTKLKTNRSLVIKSNHFTCY